MPSSGNVWSLAVGAKRKVTDMVSVPGGFAWNRNPIPDAATLFNIQLPAINTPLTDRVDIVGSVVYGVRHSIGGQILQIPGSEIELRQDLTTMSLGFSFKL